jgi:two-component system chemotaxis response regulator CheB
MAIRVLVVDDSFFMRKLISNILTSDEIKVVGTAQNGLEAIEKLKKLKPDVITLDVEMPILDGLATLREIMEKYPTPVIMVSSHTANEAQITIQAFELGAVDNIEKPRSQLWDDMSKIQQELIDKVKTASQIFVKSISQHNRGTSSFQSTLSTSKNPPSYIVVIGASTGGPRTLMELFSYLPQDSGAAFLIVQHMASGFTAALAKHLSSISQIPIQEVIHETSIYQNCGYLATGGKHMVLKKSNEKYKVGLEDGETYLGVKPAIDILMKSVAQNVQSTLIGVVLTGMGKDGTLGLKYIKAGGGITFAQDAASCIVYGMPRSAVESKVVDFQETIPQMADKIVRIIKNKCD